MSVNKVILIGNVGQDPDVKTTSNGTTVANFSLATTEKWKDKTSGQMREETEWHRCVAYGRTAEIIGEYVKKGSKLYIEGRLQTNRWKDQNDIERFTTEVIVNPVGGLQMLDSLSGGQQGPQKPAPIQPQAQQQVPAQQQAPMQQQMQQAPVQQQTQQAPVQQQTPAQQAPQQTHHFDDDIPF